MEIALFMDTHGLGRRDDHDWFLQPTPATALRPVKIAQLAEQHGFHSLWFSDHVTLPLESESGHVANPETRTRAYPPRPTMMDGAVVMGAIAASTSRICMSPSVLIAPYRGPLNDARQFATIDVLSNGRVIMGVGAGWAKEEFDALGLDYDGRGKMTEECIEIYKRSWTDDVVSFHGEYYNFDDLSMDPKPVQKPRPPIIFGGISRAGARRAARLCDGFFPIFLDPYSDPHRYDPLQDIIRREAAEIGKDLSAFWMVGCQSAHLTNADHELAKKSPRWTCAGTVEQVLEDLEKFAGAGYGLMILHFDCPSGSVDELEEQIDRAGRELLPQAKKIRASGEWKADYTETTPDAAA